ncbi:MAG: tRNA 2-thiocytidine biosynthesis protein TtcA [Thermodesulfobacterium sp.]|nr:tRNA 2-thiocytidine biosynthesis protein TtcA [Thermodesulfobacterium sp.]
MSLYKKLNRLIGKALFRYEMVKNGDFVVIALSGGEDSLALAYFLNDWRKKMRIDFKILAVHLDMGFPKDEREYKEGVKWLENFCNSLGIDFYFNKTDCGIQAMEAYKKNIKTPCFVCSWHRRKYLFKLAQEKGANKLAFGHHLDDAIVTFFMNVFYHGELSTLLPVQEMFKGNLYIIRPLILVEKNLISRFAKNGWKVIKNPCPFAGESKRKLIEEFLENKVYTLGPKVKRSIATAIFNPRFEYLPIRK